jgi:hypothetical protein
MRSASLQKLLSILVLGIFSAPASASHYGPKARQSEAKIRLAAIYAEERTYFFQNAHYPSQPILIFAVDAENKHTRNQFMLGIPDACATTTEADRNISQAAFEGLFQNQPNEVRDAFRSIKAEECKPASGGFRIYAIGKMVRHAPLDIWTIDQDKVLTNVQIGLPNGPVPSESIFQKISDFFR